MVNNPTWGHFTLPMILQRVLVLVQRRVSPLCMKTPKNPPKRDKLINFNLNNRRLVRLKVHVIKQKKKSCTDGENPTKN